MPLFGPKYDFRNVLLYNPHSMITWSKINLWEHNCSFKLIKKIINFWKGILILYSLLVQLYVIYTHPHCPIFSFKKSTRAPYGKWLGLINHLYSNSYCNFVKAKGALEIGWALGHNSISNSISHLGGSSSKSYGKTSK